MGAHFLTDVMGGIVVAFVGIKLTLLIFKKFKIESKIFEIKAVNSNYFFLSIIKAIDQHRSIKGLLGHQEVLHINHRLFQSDHDLHNHNPYQIDIHLSKAHHLATSLHL